MTALDLEKKIRDGLAGVTPGPWVFLPSPSAGDEAVFVLLAQPSPMLRGFTMPIAWAGAGNIEHFARCNPANILAILDAWKADREALAASEAARETAEAVARVKRDAVAVVRDLLDCPAISDGNHNDPEWGDEETAEAERAARAFTETNGGDDGK